MPGLTPSTPDQVWGLGGLDAASPMPLVAGDRRAWVYVCLHHVLALALGKPLVHFPREIAIRTARSTRGCCDAEHELPSVTFGHHRCYLTALVTNNSPADKREVERVPEVEAAQRKREGGYVSATEAGRAGRIRQIAPSSPCLAFSTQNLVPTPR